MRRAEVLTDSLRVHKAPGGKNDAVGYINKHDVVEVIGGPIQRVQRWWEIRACPIGKTPFEGWVSEGYQGAIWLKVEPEEEPEPRRPTDLDDMWVPSRPADESDFPMGKVMLWAGGFVVAVLVLWAAFG